MAGVECKVLLMEGRGHGRWGVVKCELEAHVSTCVGVEQVYSTLRVHRCHNKHV